MQAIIMAAGKGSRIEELTNGHPKSFLEINGKSLIERNIDMLQSHGIEDIIIVTGYHDWEFEELLGERKNIKLIYNPFFEMTNVLGSFFIGMDSLHDDFIYLHADTICEDSVFEDLINAVGYVVLPIDTKPCDEEAMKVKIVDGKIEEITKEMAIESAVGEFIGIAKIHKDVINDLKRATKELLRAKKFTCYFEASLQKLIDMKKYDFRIIDVSGKFWAEIDFAKDYEEAISRQ